MSKEKRPSVVKFIKDRNIQNLENVGHNAISFILNVLAIFIMMYIGTKYINSSDATDRAFAGYAFLLSGMGLLGFFAIDWFEDRKISFLQLKAKFTFKPDQFNRMETFKFIMTFGLVFFVALMIDVILGVVIRLALSDTDLVLYYVFAGVCEEAFFRAFLINVMVGLVTKKGQKPRIITLIIAIVISSFAFMLAHMGVYGSNPTMLLSTLLGGFLLGTAYVVMRDIGANMAAHGGKNVIGYLNLTRF